MGVRYVSLCKTKNVSNGLHILALYHVISELTFSHNDRQLGVAMRLVLLCMSILDIMLLYDASTGTPYACTSRAVHVLVLVPVR
jgi:hypothetical protein